MNKHRENLLKLIKMMEAIQQESILDNKTRDMIESESERYIQFNRLISIRELTRMFIEELNSEYLKCSEGDEIVRYIEDMIEWLQLAYDFTIEHNAGSTGVKSLKICNQTLNDYKNIYDKAKIMYKAPSETYSILKVFEFGKKPASFNEKSMTVNNKITYQKNHDTIQNLKEYLVSLGGSCEEALNIKRDLINILNR
jgi:hypothetical protein